MKSNKKRKENFLSHFEVNKVEGDCLALQILFQMREQFAVEYNDLKVVLQHQEVNSKRWNETLNKIRKTYNQKAIIIEAINHIELIQKQKKEKEIVPIEIKGRKFFRFGIGSDYSRSCKGKQPYSESSAKQAAIEVAKKLNESMDAYKCRHCEHWHIGHSIS